MKKVRVDIGNKSYEVTIEIIGGSEPAAKSSTSLPVLAPSIQVAQTQVKTRGPATPAPSLASTGSGTVCSSLCGKIVEVSAAIGDHVTVGTAVATVEAMKMNTYIHAAQAGRIAEIFVRAGDGVQEGSPIIRIE